MKWAAALVLSVIAVTWILLAILEKPIRLQIEAELDRQLNARVVFDELDMSLWHDFPNPTVSLKSLAVTGLGVFESDTLLSAPALSAEVSVWGLLRGHIELKSILVDKPRIRLIALRDGQTNYNIAVTDTTSAPQTSSDVHIDLDKVTIRKGWLDYRDEASRTELWIKDLDHTGKGSFGDDVFDYMTYTHIGEITTDYNGVRFFDRRNMEVELGLNINTRTKKYSVLHNSVRINHFKFKLEGDMSLLPEGYAFDLRFSTPETNLRNILSLLPGIYMEDAKHFKTTGEASFNGFVKGVYTGLDNRIPAFHVDLRVKDGTFQIDTLPAPLHNIQFELVLDNRAGITDSTIYDLRQFHFDLGDQPFRGRLKVQGSTQYQVDLDVQAAVNLHELETIVHIPGFDMRGALTAEIIAHGKYFPPLQGKPWWQPEELPLFTLSASLADGALHYDSLPATIEDIHLQAHASNTTGNWEDTRISLDRMHMLVDDNLLSGYTHISGLKDMQIDADLHMSLDIGDLATIFPIKGYELAGSMYMDWKTKGNFNAAKGAFPITSARLILQNGYLKSASYPEPIDQAFLTAELTNRTGQLKDTRLEIQQLKYQFEEEPFVVSGTVADFQQWNYDLKVNGLVDLAKLTRIYPVNGFFLRGIVDMNVETIGKLADLEAGLYGKTSTSGTVEIKDLFVTGYEIPRPLRIDDALFKLAPTSISLERLQGAFGKSAFTMTGNVTHYLSFLTKNDDLIKGQLNLKCDTLFMSELVPVTDSTALASKGGLSVIPVPTNLDFTLDSEIGNALYEDIRITGLDGTLRIRDGVLSMHETGFNSLGAAFNVSGDYDTRDLKHPKFDFDIDVKELDIQKAWHGIRLMRTLAPAAEHSEGQFSMKYLIKGELAPDLMPRMETLVGGGRMRIANARINGMKIFEELSKAAKKGEMNDPHLRDFTMDTEIRNSKIFVKPFAIKISGFNAEIEGVNEISGAIQYLVKLELLPIEGIRIPFHVTGTYDNPKVALGKGHKLPE